MRILSSIVLVAAAANVGSALAPRGKTRRTVLFAVSLATLLALLLPILSSLGDLPDPPALAYEEETAAFDPSVPIARAAERALSEEIGRRFGVAPPSVSVTLPKTEGDPGAIRVVLAKSDARLKGKIAAWLNAESKAEITVETEEEDAV